MKLSVIIPCYNAERYLGECLDSVLSQSETDFEVILVDDGSRDGTLAIARDYASRDARVTALHQENAGVCAARNLGLDRARGEWVTFVDADDLLVPDAFSAMLGAADGAADMVVCAHETFDAAGNTQLFQPQTRWFALDAQRKRRAVALRLIEGDSVLNIMCNKLHRRALIEREGLRLVPGLALAEDALFNLEAALCGREIRYVNRVTYRYRTHAASATQTRARSEMDAHRPWLLALRELLARRGVLEAYYPAFVDSVVLRLYKDGGVGGVVRGFGAQARPLLLRENMDVRRMSLRARALLWLCESGAYAAVYPLIAPVQMAKRKLGEAAFALRREKEKPE